MENFNIKDIPIERFKKVLKKKNPIISSFLSFLITGGGQFYNGDIAKGILFIFVAILLYQADDLIQIFFMTATIIEASNSSQNKNRKINKFLNYLKSEENITLEL